MPFTLTDLENAITAQNTVLDSVATLLNKLTDELAQANAANNSDALAHIISEIQANTARLTSAVIANTPGGHAVVTPIQVSAEVGTPLPVTVPLPVDETVHDDTVINSQPAVVDAPPPAAVDNAVEVNQLATNV